MKEYVIKLLVTVLIGLSTILAGIILLILSPYFAYKANRKALACIIKIFGVYHYEF